MKNQNEIDLRNGDKKLNISGIIIRESEIILICDPVKVKDELKFNLRSEKNNNYAGIINLKISKLNPVIRNFNERILIVFRMVKYKINHTAKVLWRIPWRRWKMSYIAGCIPVVKNYFLMNYGRITNILCGLSLKPGSHTDVAQVISGFTGSLAGIFRYIKVNSGDLIFWSRRTPGYSGITAENFHFYAASSGTITLTYGRYYNKNKYFSSCIRRTPVNA